MGTLVTVEIDPVSHDDMAIVRAATADMDELKNAVAKVAEIRRTALRRLVDAGARPTRLANDLGVSRQQIYRLLAKS